MVGIALLLATPFGILSAIYINEYEPFSALSNAVRFVAKLLTGIPSIICGVFAYAVVVLTTGGFSAWAGGFALAILILPTILLTAEQALLGVSKAYREASYGLGATNFQTIWRVVLPDAMRWHARQVKPPRSSLRRSSANSGSSHCPNRRLRSRCLSIISRRFPLNIKSRWPGQHRWCW